MLQFALKNEDSREIYWNKVEKDFGNMIIGDHIKSDTDIISFEYVGTQRENITKKVMTNQVITEV